MTRGNRRNPISLSHILPDFSPQIGINVGTIQPTLELHINISRAAPSTARLPRDKSGQSAAVSSDATPQSTSSPSNARRQLHSGTSPPHREKISGKWHTLIYPSPDGSFRVIYTKTQTAFTLTPPPSSDATVAITDKEEKPSIQEIDGYRFTFGAPRPITHSEMDRFNMANSPGSLSLEGRPLEIHRDGFGKEYFLLTNYYFIDASRAETAGDQSSALDTKSANSRVETSTGGRNKDKQTTTQLAVRSLEIELKHDEKLVTKRTFCLDDPPVKLGDGSFGVVYQVREVSGRAANSTDGRDAHVPAAKPQVLGKRHAIKIFYNRQMMTRTGLVRVEPKTFNEFTRRHASRIEQVQEISIAELFDHVFSALKAEESMETVQARFWEILKQSEKLQNVSAKRFGREREISSNIRAVFDSEIRVNASEIACVQTEYDTTRFRESAMFQFLRSREQQKGAVTVENLSDYAIVMEWCDATLEDVLEGHWQIWGETQGGDDEPTSSGAQPTGSPAAARAATTYRAKPVVIEGNPGTTAKGESGKDGGKLPLRPPGHAKTVTGYAMLKCLLFAQRLAVIHPFLVGLAEALQMLHATRNYHHDIKPGNVFIKKTINNFHVTLGDFSFVGSGVDEGTTEAVLRDSIQTGSLHFRSPEQRDFNDAAYGIVRHAGCCDGPGEEYQGEANGEGDGWAYVRILDPKFRRSTIGPNDIIVFPVDRNGTGYRIRRVHTSDKHRDVWLNVDPKEFQGLFPEETRTKVFLYKIPTIRSDLFGLGAVFFDLITGGESAERFYEALRPFDVPFKKGEEEGAGVVEQRGYSVEDIITNFEAYRKNRGSVRNTNIEAALLHMFEFFRDGNDFAPGEAVRIIVKLMGAHLEDSYFSTKATERGVSEYLLKIDEEALPVSWALEDIREISRKGIYDWREQMPQQGMDNLLFRPEESQQHLARIASAIKATEAETTQTEDDDLEVEKEPRTETSKWSIARWILGKASVMRGKLKTDHSSSRSET